MFLYKFKKHSNAEFYKSFCQYRNKVQREIKIAKSEYLSNKMEENKNNSRKLWQQVKTLGYSQTTKSSPNIVLDIDGENCYDDKKIANHFNSFFTTVASALVQKLPPCSNLYSVNSETFLNFYKKKNPDGSKFALHTVSEDFVYKELCKLKSSKSTGLDSIPARFLKDGASFLKLPVTYIINVSITGGVVPGELKSARVKPLFKKSCRSQVGNYRPVSILCIVSKILERAVYFQLESFLTKNKLIYELQSGFRENYSTDSCLIHLTDHIKHQTSKGLLTGMIMLDLQKAFDTVDHGILCEKLKVMGVESVGWFYSYLSNRTQVVNINQSVSDIGNVTCGVPQGSILGPLLFLCYINDMVTSINNDCKLMLYADDSAIIFSHRDPDVIAHRLGKELESCSQWLVDNKLSLHLGKTECIMFGSKRKLRKTKDFSIFCNGQNIKSQKSVKYLGVELDQSLSGESIASSVIKKVNSRLKFLYRQGYFLNASLRQMLCNSLIQCHFDYASASWYSGLTNHFKKRLQIVQNKVVRFIYNYGPRTSVKSSDLSGLGMLDVESRVKQMRLNHVYKVFNRNCPMYLNDNLVRLSDLHCYNTRGSQNNFYVPNVNSISRKTFYYNGIIDWNCLPDSLKQIRNKWKFKKEVKKYLMQQLNKRENSIWSV